MSDATKTNSRVGKVYHVMTALYAWLGRVERDDGEWIALAPGCFRVGSTGQFSSYTRGEWGAASERELCPHLVEIPVGSICTMFEWPYDLPSSARRSW